MAAGHSTLTEPEMRSEGYLLVREAARKIGVSSQTIYRWIAENKVEGFRNGYRRYVNWRSILRHLGPQACKIRDLRRDDVFVPTEAR